MRRLLILLVAHHVSVCLGCDTAVAYPGHSLSLYRSSMANADVALLKSYGAEDVNQCLHDCCTEKYGSCSVASFKKNATGDNSCQLFNCLPVQKCMFESSNSTDSFSISSSANQPRVLVPSSSSRHASDGSPSTTSTTTTTTSTSPPATADDPVALKDDNTSVKPRKGVVDGLEDIFGSDERSGVKPRKGVSLEGVGGAKSKVKPRKGVGPQPSSSAGDLVPVSTTPAERNESRASPTPKVYQDVVADELASALERVFEDDVRDKPMVTSSKDLVVDNLPKTSVAFIRPSSSVDYRGVVPTSLAATLLSGSSSSLETTTESGLLPSLEMSHVASSSVLTPYLQTTGVVTTGVLGRTPTPSSPTILEHSRLIFHEVSVPIDSEESESERKYKSSMHLVLSLVIGLLILVSVLGVVAKRVYDSWMRRHYRRMDFLIDGMYNGYG